MKFIHIADLHLDCIFSNLSDCESLGEKRRLEQRKQFAKIINYIKENKIDMLFISGDLYEEKYITKSSIEFINKLFKEIEETRIYISPGNHDPYIKNSYYEAFNWSDNVVIFKGEVEKVSCENYNIFGYGFTDFYDDGSLIQNFEINEEDRSKTNILVMHADLDKVKTGKKDYNPIGKSVLERKGFDYVALGHIHKTNYDECCKIIYPGSMISLGFDELGCHGMIEGEIEGGNVSTKLIKLEEDAFLNIDLDVTYIEYFEELVEKINLMNYGETFIRVNLIGTRNFEININRIYSLVENINIIKIKDNTEISVDLDALENDSTLKGIFVRKINSELNNVDLTEFEKKKLNRMLEIGLEALK